MPARAPSGCPGDQSERLLPPSSLRDNEPVTRDVVVLGSTGSIGTQALDVVTRNPSRFRIVGLAAGGNAPDVLATQVRSTGAEVVAVPRADRADAVRSALPPDVKLLAGPDALSEIAGWPCDVVLNAVPGAAGLSATLASLATGRTLALANKESLIIGGPLVADRIDQIVPVDSEHSALAQCLRAGASREVRKLVLTASGGPFRGRSRAELVDVTPAQALAHPTWDMGPLVTVNSATLVNKGLELIEAHLLFGVAFDRIAVVVHPQSVVHSLVEFIDGATIAQASPPDMRLPISLGLSWPERVADAAPPVDWSQSHSWQFAPLDEDAFPAVRLARVAGTRGGTAPAVYNAANEVAVAAFLAGRLPFLGIVDTIERILLQHGTAYGAESSLCIEDVLAADAWARARAGELIGGAS
jgi:1-deoxy-D-xylulose-5-phosphate reductoisomerase